MESINHHERPAHVFEAWISDDLISETKQVWRNEFNCELTDAEAAEILMNWKRLAEILMRAKANTTQDKNT